MAPGGRAENIPKALFLYDEGISGFDFKKIKNFIKDNFGGIKVRLIRLKDKAVRTRGLLFDFTATQKAFAKFTRLSPKDSVSIILTNRLFATYDEQKKLHIRACIFGFPSVISSSGIVEGPAKPKKYYLYKQELSRLGAWELGEVRLKQRFKGRFIDYKDKRLTEVIKGYIAQAMFFYITAEPFCGEKRCRLYNAHWQEDLIYSQVRSGKFCRKHKNILIAVAKNFS